MARLLVMEGNTLARQAEAARLGVRSSSGIYIEAVKAHFPEITCDIVHAADRGQALQPGAAFTDYAGLIIGGSGLHAYAKQFEVTNQIDLLKSFAETGKPILGSCWGLQIAAIAGGGTVDRSPNGREVGVARKIALSARGQQHALYRNKPTVFDAPCIHYDEVTALPSGSEVLSGNRHSAIQGAVVPLGHSEVWAVQYHPEFDLQHLSKIFDLYSKDMVEQGFFMNQSDAGAYKADLDVLAEQPSDTTRRWRLGIDDDILVPEIRRAEIINWIDSCILI
jgi:GMP synthase (glutamine-hydrolysing)